LPRSPAPRLRFSASADELALVRGVADELRCAPAPGRSAPRALVAPHLDLALARPVYRSAFAALGMRPPQRIVLLGTGHALTERPIALGEADLETRFGCWPTERAAVRVLRAAGAEAVAPGDRALRGEHALAHPLLFLHRLLGADARVPIVPVLLGPIAHRLDEVDRPAELPELAPLLAALATFCDARTLVVASVDLSHVGPRFGDPEPAARYEPEVLAHDRALLDALCRGSVRELWREARRVRDRFRVCGLAVLACLLELLPAARGELLAHALCHDEESASAVSCAALRLDEPGAAVAAVLSPPR
jgi:hypothetical protein